MTNGDKDRKKYQYAPAFNVQQPYGPKKEFILKNNQ